MNKSKRLDSCIEILKAMRGDQSNELESEQQRALTEEIRKLKKLKMRSKISHEELYRVVNEVAETVSRLMR